MLRIENQLINHRQQGQAQRSTRMTESQEIKFPMDKNVLRRKKKRLPGGESIY